MSSFIFLNGNYMKNFLTITIILIITGLWGYYFLYQKQAQLSTPSEVVINPTPSIEVPIYPSATLVPSQIPIENDIIQIKQAFSDKYGNNIDDIDIKLSADDGLHAVGTVTFKLAMEGGHFLAAKATDIWLIVQDGNGVVMCDAVSSYKFPVSMVSECVDSQGKLIKL